MTQGLKVSKPTKDISSTEPRDFVLHSEYNTCVIYKEDEVSVVIPANSSVESVVNFDRTFSIIPMVLIYIELTTGSNNWFLTPFTFYQSSDPEDTYILQYDTIKKTIVKNDKFYLTLVNKTASEKTIKYRYYLLMNL